MKDDVVGGTKMLISSMLLAPTVTGTEGRVAGREIKDSAKLRSGPLCCRGQAGSSHRGDFALGDGTLQSLEPFLVSSLWRSFAAGAWWAEAGGAA